MRIKATIVAYTFSVQCFENATIVAYAGLRVKHYKSTFYLWDSSQADDCFWKTSLHETTMLSVRYPLSVVNGCKICVHKIMLIQ